MEPEISDRIKELYDQAQILVVDDSIFSRTLIHENYLLADLTKSKYSRPVAGEKRWTR